MWTILWIENGQDKWDRFDTKEELIDFIIWYSEQEYAFYSKTDNEIIFNEDVLIFTPEAGLDHVLGVEQLLEKEELL